MVKRTIAFFNPNERAKAEKEAAKYRKQNPGKKVIIERHPKWKTLDVRTISRTKKKSRTGLFKF